MTIHYHGTPITPVAELLTLAGKHFCVSHARPDDVIRVHQIGQSVMLDNGAYSKFTREEVVDWAAYYEWCDKWFTFPLTWAVIPDEIAEGSQAQDHLLREWPHGPKRGAPVWHMNEPIDRLVRLTEQYEKVCIGSTDEFWVVLSDAWRLRMDEAWNALARNHRRLPWVHMLRGMRLGGLEWPFASLDSTNVARNHNRAQNTAKKLADKLDSIQCQGHWIERVPTQIELPLRRVTA